MCKLGLSDEAMELADRHQIEEFRLRHVLKLSSEDHAEMVQQIIECNLSGRQIQEICEHGLLEPTFRGGGSQNRIIMR